MGEIRALMNDQTSRPTANRISQEIMAVESLSLQGNKNGSFHYRARTGYNIVKEHASSLAQDFSISRQEDIFPAPHSNPAISFQQSAFADC